MTHDSDCAERHQHHQPLRPGAGTSGFDAGSSGFDDDEADDDEETDDDDAVDDDDDDE